MKTWHCFKTRHVHPPAASFSPSGDPPATRLPRKKSRGPPRFLRPPPRSPSPGCCRKGATYPTRRGLMFVVLSPTVAGSGEEWRDQSSCVDEGPILRHQGGRPFFSCRGVVVYEAGDDCDAPSPLPNGGGVLVLVVTLCSFQ